MYEELGKIIKIITNRQGKINEDRSWQIDIKHKPGDLNRLKEKIQGSKKLIRTKKRLK